MSRKLIFLFSVLVIASMLLAACGGTAETPPPVVNPNPPTEATLASPTTAAPEQPTAAPKVEPTASAPDQPTTPKTEPTAAAPVASTPGDFKVEINQALGVQYKDAKNFVAGKPTAVLAYLKAAAKVDEATTQAVVTRDGKTVTTLKPKTQDNPGTVVEFLCPDMPTCGEWQAGKYQFDVTVNGAKVSSEALNFVESKIVRVLAVNVKAKYGATVTQVKGDDWKKMDDFTRATYPIATANLRWTIRDEIDGTANDLETNEGRAGLWQLLAGLVPNSCQANPTGEGCYEMVVGFISDRPNGYPNGNLQGYTYGMPATIAVASDQDARATVAHEIAHVFAIGDTYAGGSLNCKVNPAPDGMAGKDWDNREKDTSCSVGAKQFAPEVSATLIDAASVHPYEVGGRGVLSNMACFMGSGGKQEVFWVTPETYASLFKALAKGQATASGVLPVSFKSAPAPKSMLYYFGYIKADGSFAAEPWYTFTDVNSEATPASPSGEKVTIKVLDAAGKEIATKADKVEFFPNTAPGAPIVKVEEAPIEGVVDFPDGAKKVQVVFREKVIYEATVSANPPVISDVTPTTAGQKIDGAYKVTWKGSDADNDKLVYTVEFNPDASNPNSEWWVLASDLTTTEWEEDLSQWPGGVKAQFRITASDGLRAGEGVSKEFSVPFKAPEAFIYDPEWGSEYSVEDEIALSAEVYDLQDDPLPDESMTWTSDQVAQPLGHGSEIIFSLPAGTHTITLTVKNSHGMETKVVLETKIVVK
jgi:hypothetical protein